MRKEAGRVLARTAAQAAVVGAVPIPVADAAILVPLQLRMLSRIGKIYGMDKSTAGNTIIDSIIQVGATTLAGRTLLSALKAVPGIQMAGVILNAIVAGTVTYTAGQVSVRVFEGIRKGTIDPETIDWMNYIQGLFGEKMPDYTKQLQEALEKKTPEEVLKNLLKILNRKENRNDDQTVQ